MTRTPQGRRPIRPETPRAGRRALVLAALVGFALAPGAAEAVVTAATYNQELNQNNGHDVPANQRNLPGGQITVTCTNGPSQVTLFSQLGDPTGVVGQF